MQDLGVNKTKNTWRKAFTVDLFALEVETKSKYDERTLFGDCPQTLHPSVNP